MNKILRILNGEYRLVVILGILCFFMAGGVYGAEDYEYPFLNPGLTVEKRVSDLLGRMTLEEKISQMGNTSPAIERFGISEFEWWCECLHGVVGRFNKTALGCTTVFNQAISMASTWNPELIHRVASVIGDEVRAKYNANKCGLNCWSPVINIARDPRWGRTQEGYGEDPYLVTRMVVAFVKGLQGDHPKYFKTLATPKHFAANNEESRRLSGSSDVEDRILREYYLPHFKASIQEANAQAVMCAYNSLNGVPCCGNKWLLTELLRNEWGFDGFVVTDCAAVNFMHNLHEYVSTPEKACALALNAGSDLNCGSYYQKHLMKAVEKGLVSEETIDISLGRLIRAKIRLGMFDPPEMVPYSQITEDIVNNKEHRELAKHAARESMVLLNNDGILPLDKNIGSIAVIGPNANVCRFGNYSNWSCGEVDPLKGIKKKVGKKTRVFYAEGCKPGIPSHHIEAKYLNTLEGKRGIRVEYFNNLEMEGEPVIDRVEKKIEIIPGDERNYIGINKDVFSVRWTGKLVPPVTRTYHLNVFTDDIMKIYLDGKLILDSQSTRAKWMVIRFQKALLLEEGRSYDLRVEYYNRDKKPGVGRLVWDYSPSAGKEISKAVKLAKKADTVVLFMGTDKSISEENQDRSILGLPGYQNELIKEVYKANPRTVLVLINGEPLAVNWANKNLPAIVEAWYPGEEGGNAIADVLFGDYNPGGKLPMTFYKSINQLPPFDDYDILKGRTYMYFEEEPLFPFGHGLSYTEFEYSNLEISRGRNKSINVKVEVKNTGKVEGDEVVQLYVHDVKASVKRPIKELRGFIRISLKPGASQNAEFVIARSDLAFYDVGQKKFVVEPGKFEIMVGSSSEDIRLKDSLVIK